MREKSEAWTVKPELRLLEEEREPVRERRRLVSSFESDGERGEGGAPPEEGIGVGEDLEVGRAESVDARFTNPEKGFEDSTAGVGAGDPVLDW
jgi:hypothetical protein